MIGLTKKQAALLAYIKSCDVIPSYEEMRVAMGMGSKSGVHAIIHRLIERGHLRSVPNRARALEVVAGADDIAAELFGAASDVLAWVESPSFQSEVRRLPATRSIGKLRTALAKWESLK